jgi:hypothetical protein
MNWFDLPTPREQPEKQAQHSRKEAETYMAEYRRANEKRNTGAKRHVAFNFGTDTNYQKVLDRLKATGSTWEDFQDAVDRDREYGYNKTLEDFMDDAFGDEYEEDNDDSKDHQGGYEPGTVGAVNTGTGARANRARARHAREEKKRRDGGDYEGWKEAIAALPEANRTRSEPVLAPHVTSQFTTADTPESDIEVPDNIVFDAPEAKTVPIVNMTPFLTASNSAVVAPAKSVETSETTVIVAELRAMMLEFMQEAAKAGKEVKDAPPQREVPVIVLSQGAVSVPGPHKCVLCKRSIKKRPDGKKFVTCFACHNKIWQEMTTNGKPPTKAVVDAEILRVKHAKETGKEAVVVGSPEAQTVQPVFPFLKALESVFAVTVTDGKKDLSRGFGFTTNSMFVTAAHVWTAGIVVGSDRAHLVMKIHDSKGVRLIKYTDTKQKNPDENDIWLCGVGCAKTEDGKMGWMPKMATMNKSSADMVGVITATIMPDGTLHSGYLGSLTGVRYAHNCSTLPGDSGSACWYGDKIIGMHILGPGKANSGLVHPNMMLSWAVIAAAIKDPQSN